MTRFGLGFIIAGVLVYLLSSQTQIGWLYLLDAIIWSLLLLSAILPWYSLRSLSIERRVMAINSTVRGREFLGPVEDDNIEVQFSVKNSGRLGKYFIKIRDECPFDTKENRYRDFFVIKLKSGSTVYFNYSANCYLRGVYSSSNVTLVSWGFLGLWQRKKEFHLPWNITVYPGYFNLEEVSITNIAWGEFGQAARATAAGEIYGSREYRYGDPLKYIHWRNTARLGRFMIREFERAGKASLTVLFEAGRSFGSGRETTLEYGIRIAASLARLQIGSGGTVGIIAGECPVLFTGWNEAMDYLAAIQMEGKTGLGDVISEYEFDGFLVVVIAAADSELISSLISLNRQGKLAAVVVLEGFVENEALGENITRLTNSGIPLIKCSKGGLEDAVNQLGYMLLINEKLPVAIN